MGKKLLEPIKSITDLVVFMLAAFVTLSLFISVIATYVFIFVNPDSDIGTPLKTVFDIITIIVGALVGFIGGRAAGRVEEQERQRNGNGAS